MFLIRGVQTSREVCSTKPSFGVSQGFSTRLEGAFVCANTMCTRVKRVLSKNCDPQEGVSRGVLYVRTRPNE